MTVHPKTFVIQVLNMKYKISYLSMVLVYVKTAPSMNLWNKLVANVNLSLSKSAI